jgi:DNA-binding transcriptional MerR regulator
MGILDDWDSMDVDFGPQSGSTNSFGGGFSDDILFGGSGGDRLKPEDGLELLEPWERTQLTWEEQRRLIAERSAEIAAKNGGGDNVKNPLAEVVAAPPSQPNYMSSETGQSINPNDPRLQTPEFDRVHGQRQQQQPEQFGPPMPSQSPNPMLDLANNPSLGQPQQPQSFRGNEIETTFVNTLRQGGLTNPYGLAAVAAYGKAESGYNPNRIAGSWSDPSESGQAGTSGGILSWRAERLNALRNFAGGGNGDVATQAQFFLQEDPQLIQALNNAKSPQEANALMANAWRFAGYNRQGGEFANRLNLTNSYLARLNGQDAGTQVADASGRFAPGAAPGSMPGPRTPGPRTQGSPRMDGTQAPDDSVQRVLAYLNGGQGGGGMQSGGGGGGMLGGLGGLLGGGGGGGGGNADMMRAIGLSLLSSPRQAPLQNLGQNLALAEKQGESAASERALAAAAIQAGIDPRLAPVLAKNPTALQLFLSTNKSKQDSNTLNDLLQSRNGGGSGGASDAISPPPTLNAPAPSGLKPPHMGKIPGLRSDGDAIQPDVIGTPEGYDWRTGGVAERAPPPAEPPARPVEMGSAPAPQAPEPTPAPIRVAQAQAPDTASDAPSLSPQQVAQVVGSPPPKRDPAKSQGTTQQFDAERKYEWGMKAVITGGKIGGDLGKAVTKMGEEEIATAREYLKEANEIKVLRQGGFSPEQIKAILAQQNDRRTDLQKNLDFVAPGDAKKQQSLGEQALPNSTPAPVRMADAELTARGFQRGTTTYNKLLPGLLEKYAKAEGGIDEVGSIRQDYRLIRNEDGSYRQEVMPGSQTARELAEAAKKETLQNKQQKVATDIVVEDIDRALEIAKTSKLPVAGLFGSPMAGVPGSPAHDVQQLLASVKANISLDRLRAMREASPSGASGLGAVTLPEHQMLQAAYGSLAQSTTPELFERNLRRVRMLYNDIVHGNPDGVVDAKGDDKKKGGGGWTDIAPEVRIREKGKN